MASIGDRYLPELAKCFAGDAIVFSWEETSQTLRRNADDISSVPLNALISSTKVKALLTQKVPIFPPPSPESRNQFERKTAAINVVLSGEKTYDIEEIKKNTTWLSEEVGLAEDEALRIVVLEWQQSPEKRLLTGYSDAEIASLQDALGSHDIDASQNLVRTLRKRNDEDYDLEQSKRKRLLELYFVECRGLLEVSRIMQELALQKDNKMLNSQNLGPFVQELDHTKSTDTGVGGLVDTIDTRLQAMGTGRTWSFDSDNINDIWIGNELQCILVMEEILLLRLRGSPETMPTDTLLRWLSIMTGCEFFAYLQPGPSLPPSTIGSLQAMATLTTLAILDPATALSTLAESTPSDHSVYFLDGDTAHDVHKVLLAAAEACIPQASPAALAWALILGEIKRQGTAAKESRESGAVQRAIDQVSTYDTVTGRRMSTGSLQQSVYEEVVSAIMNTSDLSDPATYLLRCAIEAAHVFDTISTLAKSTSYGSALLNAISLQVLQELLTVAVATIGYAPEILGSQFSILSSEPIADANLPDIRETFVKNDFIMDNIFAVAAGRFPYESLPFLRLCRLLASAKIFDEQGVQYIMFRLRTMESYTQSAIGPFAAYHTIREDENLNLVALDNPVNMFQKSQTRLSANGQPHVESGIIAAETLGEVISESVPPVVRWQHNYSGLALLGVWLELHYLGQLQSILSPYESAEDVITEVIAIITILLETMVDDTSTTINEAQRKHLQHEFLEETSSILQTNSNIADYILEILEQELQAYRRRPSNTFNTSVLVVCINFASVWTKLRPDQFWATFSKSSLLESYGSDGFLLSVISGVEVPNQDFPLLQACAKLLQSITKAALQRPGTVNSKSNSKTRLPQPQNLRLHGQILSAVTQSLYTAFEAIPGWIFASSSQLSSIVTSIASSFKQIIDYSSTGGRPVSSLTAPFISASEFLIVQFRGAGDDVSSTNPLLRHLFHIEAILNGAGVMSITNAQINTSHAVISLSTTLVKIGKLKPEQPSALDQQLFNAVPLLFRNIVRSGNNSGMSLIHNLLRAVGQSGPVSLLGHLGSSSAICILEILKFSLGDWKIETSKVSTWELLSKLVGRNQQWLAIVILTGSPPESSRRNNAHQGVGALRGRTFMEIALKQLVRIAEMDSSVAISILKFVIKAQMNWSWANEAMKSNKDFLPAIMSFVCNTYVDASDEIKLGHRNKIAALVTDLSTIHLHHAKAKRDTTTLNTITPLLRWLAGNAIQVASYNHSLHSNLRKNFASKFMGLELNDFKRTSLNEVPYGDDYYYDLSFANVILKNEPQWDRQDRYRDQSFCAEVRRANLNLSVVDSELQLLNSFLHLCVEHSGHFAQDIDAQKTVIGIVKNCLDANTRPHSSEKIFENVLQIRADIALSLLQRLIDAKARGFDVRDLLKHAWECARVNNGSFEQAIIDNNLTYWRSMLTIISMCLQFQIDKKYMPPAADSSPAALLRHTEQSIPTILEIVTVIVGQGFRSVAATLQDQRRTGVVASDAGVVTVSYKDVYLIMTIFETILRMTRLPEFITEASQRLIAEGAIQSCLLLYSWSHMITEPEFDNEPVYAGYCLRFLASLSSLPPVTEELAVEGILSRLLSARMTQRLQAVPDGAGHVDKRPQIQSLYNLWATGVLPICLNLLHSVGAPISSEVSVFLNQFPNQLNRASVAFIPSQPRSGTVDALTSTVADEAATLALISFILASFRNAGASAAVDPSSIQLLMGYDEHKKALSEDIADIVNSTSASLKNRIMPLNEKEQALARDKNGEGLVDKVVSELRHAITCLKGEEVEDDK